MKRFVALLLVCVSLAMPRIAAADGTDTNLDFSRNSATKNVVLVVLGTTAVVGLSGALFWEVKGLSAKGDRSGLGDPHSLCGESYSTPECQTWTQSIADQDEAGKKQIPFLAVGAGAGLAFFFTAVIWPNDPKKLALVPSASPAGAGLTLHGEF